MVPVYKNTLIKRFRQAAKLFHNCFGELFLIAHPRPQPFPIGNELDGTIVIYVMCIEYR